jgi:predicted DCC family thiol-disulfide oxidoreductase YuxK
VKPGARKQQTGEKRGLDPRPLHVLIDGACPFCRAQADVWRRLDRGRGRIMIEDITAPEFDAARWGLRPADVLAEMHVMRPGGRIERGVDAVQAVYAALGWGWLGTITGCRATRPILRQLYRLVAGYRPRYRRRASDGSPAWIDHRKSARGGRRPS